MSSNLVTHEVLQLDQLALHEMAKTLWKNLVSQHPEEMSKTFLLTGKDRLYDVNLYRDTVQRLLTEHLPPRFPKLLKEKLVDAMVDIKLGYTEAFLWIIRSDDVIALSQRRDFNLIEECQNLICSLSSPNTGKYDAIHFIKPLGRFDDLSWAKLFVADENQSLKSRFYLACLYCFEQEIHSLWSAMKNASQTLLQNEIEEMSYNAKHLVQLWVSRVKGETQFSFYLDGWECSIQGLNEHAATFFWSQCSDLEKSRILSELNWGLVYCASFNSAVNAGFVHFIYSLVSTESKYNYMCDSHFQTVSILSSMLSSPYYKTVINDTLTDPSSVPLIFYGHLLQALGSVIQKYSITRHKEIFKILWNRLSEDDGRIEVLNSVNIISLLIDINDFDLFETVILPLPCCVKIAFLLKGFPGYSPVDLFMRENFEGLLPYLLFLLLDNNDHKLKLRTHAEELLDSFIGQSELYYQFRMFNVVTVTLKEALPLMRSLLDQMEETTIAHDFLARKIYPLFM